MKIVDKNNSGEIDYSGNLKIYINRMAHGNHKSQKFIVEIKIRNYLQNDW